MGRRPLVDSEMTTDELIERLVTMKTSIRRTKIRGILQTRELTDAQLHRIIVASTSVHYRNEAARKLLVRDTITTEQLRDIAARVGKDLRPQAMAAYLNAKAA